jgi:hypothetical protein
MHEKLLSPAQHETRDVGTSLIWIGVPLLLISVVALSLLVLWLFPKALVDQSKRLGLPQFPNPQLQTNPRESMAQFHAEEIRRLNSTGWIDKATGRIHIPIGDAMRKVVEEGIPDWPSAQEKPP